MGKNDNSYWESFDMMKTFANEDENSFYEKATGVTPRSTGGDYMGMELGDILTGMVEEEPEYVAGGDLSFLKEFQEKVANNNWGFTPKYMDKEGMIRAFNTSYVLDFGPDDPYHHDMDDTDKRLSELTSGIRYTYGYPNIDKYIIAMRKLYKCFDILYEKNKPFRISKSEYIDNIISGEITISQLPLPKLRNKDKVSKDIIIDYIINEDKDLKELVDLVNNDDCDVSGYDLNDVDLFTKQELEDIENIADHYENSEGSFVNFDATLNNAVIKKRMNPKWKMESVRDVDKTTIDIVSNALDNYEAHSAYMISGRYISTEEDDPGYVSYDNIVGDIKSRCTIVPRLGNMSNSKAHSNYRMRKALTLATSGISIDGFYTIKKMEERIQADGNNSKIFSDNISDILNETRVIKKNGKLIKANTAGSLKSQMEVLRDKQRVYEEVDATIFARIEALNYSKEFRAIVEEYENLIIKHGMNYFVDD